MVKAREHRHGWLFRLLHKYCVWVSHALSRQHELFWLPAQMFKLNLCFTLFQTLTSTSSTGLRHVNSLRRGQQPSPSLNTFITLSVEQLCLLQHVAMAGTTMLLALLKAPLGILQRTSGAQTDSLSRCAAQLQVLLDALGLSMLPGHLCMCPRGRQGQLLLDTRTSRTADTSWQFPTFRLGIQVSGDGSIMHTVFALATPPSNS